MTEPVSLTVRQEARLAKLLELDGKDAEPFLGMLRRFMGDYLEMDSPILPPRRAADLVKQVHAHAEALADSFEKLAAALREPSTEWLMEPLRRCCLRSGEIVAALPERFPTNQPDWQARSLVYDLLILWRFRHGTLPAKGPDAPFTRFVQAVFGILEGEPGGRPARDARALIDAALAKWKAHHEQSHPPGERIEGEALEDYLAHKDAEDFFGGVASLIFGQL